ncbi:MAG: S8 family serine peptidase [Halobaculum sp.]
MGRDPEGESDGAGTASVGSGSQTVPWGVERVGAREAHANGVRGAGVDVAVLDTGVAPDHPDLSLAAGTTVVPETDSWADPSGHGTHAAGVIAATDDTSGVVGVAPAVRLHPVRVFERAGTGDLATVARGLRWVARREYDVASVSITSRIESEAVAAATQTAVEAGVVVVAATAEEDVAFPGYPAAYDGVVACGALARDGSLAEFSRRSGVDVVAPGVGVASTVPGGYARRSGTSVACPHVAGVAALLRATGLDATATVERLQSTSGDPPAVDASDLG